MKTAWVRQLAKAMRDAGVIRLEWSDGQESCKLELVEQHGAGLYSLTDDDLRPSGVPTGTTEAEAKLDRKREYYLNLFARSKISDEELATLPDVLDK